MSQKYNQTLYINIEYCLLNNLNGVQIEIKLYTALIFNQLVKKSFGVQQGSEGAG